MALNLKKAGFSVVEDEEVAVAAPASDAKLAEAQAQAQRATQMLLLAIKTSSDRAIAAVFNLFTVATVASAWWLWTMVLPNPSVDQLVGLAIYALFILTVEVIRRKYK